MTRITPRLLARRLAIRLLRRYPQPWQDRYGDEVMGLIEDSPVRLRDLGELARGLVTERARALVASADRPRRTAAILSALPPVFALLFTSLAYGSGAALRKWGGGVSSGMADLGTWLLIVSVVVWIVIEVVVRVRRRGHASPFLFRPLFPVWAGLATLPVFFAGVMLVDLTIPPGSVFPIWIHVLLNMYWMSYFAARLSSGLWPRRALLRALRHLAGLEERVSGAQSWVEGCRTMIAQGVPSPLAEAQAEVDRWTRERDEVLKNVHAMSYEARFRST